MHLTLLGWIIAAFIFGPIVLVMVARILALLTAAFVLLFKLDPESRERRLLDKL